MTLTDPWAAAQVTSPAGDAGQTSQLGDSFSGGGDSESQLFGGGNLYPSLFNKTHLLGTERFGVITKAPYDVHSLTFDKPRKRKYWDGNGGVTTEEINPVTRRPNEPIMDTMIELATEYRLDAAERAAIDRDASYEDDGSRTFVASAQGLKETKDAIARFNKANPARPIRSPQDMVGLRIRVKRAGTKPNPKGNPSWILQIELAPPQ